MFWKLLSLAWRFRKAIALALIVGAVWWWHSGKVSAARKEGAHAERVVWEEAQRRAEAARAEEHRQAADAIAALEMNLIGAEEAAQVAEKEHAEELERAIEAAGDRARAVVPDGLLVPLRKVR